MDIDELRDSLILSLDGAVKFEPMLADLARAEFEKLPISTIKGTEPAALASMIERSLEGRREAILAEAQDGHDRFIAQLRAELQSDPDGRGYAKMTPEEIASEMVREIEVVEERDETPREIVRRVLSGYVKLPADLAIREDGAADNAPPDLDLDIQQSLQKPHRVMTITGVRQAPCWRVICGIPYGRNVVRVQEIIEALA